MAALFRYLQRTQLFLADPDFAMYNDADLVNWINMARGQIAGQSECIRAYGTLALVAANQQYLFSAIDTGTSAVTGIAGVLNVRQVTYSLGTGQKMVTSRPFAWFNSFVLSNPIPTAAAPATWSQLGQGASGSLFFNLLDAAYTASLDVVCYPNELADDTSVEAIPYQFTDIIPFMAAYFAAITAQKPDMAEKFWNEAEKFSVRARAAATSSVLPSNFPQTPDPMVGNRLGLPQQRGQP